MIPLTTDPDDVLVIDPDRLAADVACRMFVRMRDAEAAERAARMEADLAFHFRDPARVRLAQACTIAEAETCSAAQRAFDAAHETMRGTAA